MEQPTLGFDWPVKMKELGICACCRGRGFIEHCATAREIDRNVCKACGGTGTAIIHKHVRPL